MANTTNKASLSLSAKTLAALVFCLSSLFSQPAAWAQAFPNTTFKAVYDAAPVTPQCSNPGFEQGLSDWTTFQAKRTSNGGLPFENYVTAVNPLMISTCSAAPGSCVNVEASGTDPNLSSASHPKTQEGGMSLRLGGTEIGTSPQSNQHVIEGAAKRFVVTASDSIYRFRFSSVMHRAHDSTAAFTGQEPYFQAIAIDPTDGSVIDSFVQPASGFNPNILASTDKPSVVYSLWACAKLDLSSHVGMEVIVYLVNSDCAHGGHVAYTYIDDTCTTCDDPEDAGIVLDEVQNLKICEPDKVTRVTGQLVIPNQPVASNITVKLDVMQGGSVITTLTNGTISGNTYSFDVSQANLNGVGCYDLVATLEYEVTTAAGNVVKVTKQTSLEGIKPGEDNDLCLEECAPVPEEAACFSDDPKITCGREPGTFVVTIDPQGTGSGMPAYVEVQSLTSGISLQSSTGIVPVRNGQAEITLVGAVPGDTIKLSVEGSTFDLSSETGMSICCNSEIEVTIPEDIECDYSKYDLAIDKTGATTPAPDIPYYSFEMNVSNLGDEIANAGAITVTDVVPNDMSFNTATGTDWSCATVPASAGETITCTYTGTGPIASGQLLPPISIDARLTGERPFPPVDNCATVGFDATSGLNDVHGFNNDSCVTVAKPEADATGEDQMGSVPPINLSATKTWDTTVTLVDGQFTITVANEGAQIDPPTVIKINDMVPANMTILSIDPSSTAWTCGPLPVTGPANLECKYNASAMPAAASSALAPLVFNAHIGSLPGQPGTPMDLENCARADGYVTDNFATPLLDSNPADNDGCVKTGVGHTQKQPDQTPDGVPDVGSSELVLDKVASGQCRIDRGNQTYECPFDIEITNQGEQPFAGPMVMTDEFGKGGLRAGKMLGDDWELTSTPDGIIGLSGNLRLAPGQSSTIVSTVIVRGLRKGGTFDNCAILGQGDGELQQLALVQAIMNQRGIEVGKVDGEIGPKTRNGLAQLRDQLNLPASETLGDVFEALGVNGQAAASCASVQLPKMPAPPLKCDARTTVRKGESCQCKFNHSAKVNATQCGCVRGYELKGGKGCVKVEVAKPKPSRPAQKQESCPLGSLRVPGAGCVSVSIGRPNKPDRDEPSAGTAGDTKRCRIMLNGICLK